MSDNPVSFNRVLREWLVMHDREPFDSPGEALLEFASFLDKASENFAESGIYTGPEGLYGSNVHNETYLTSVASEAIIRIFGMKPGIVRIIDTSNHDFSSTMSYTIEFEPLSNGIPGASLSHMVVDECLNEYSLRKPDMLIAPSEEYQKSTLTDIFSNILRGRKDED